jgi:hypothetical protein
MQLLLLGHCEYGARLMLQNELLTLKILFFGSDIISLRLN